MSRPSPEGAGAPPTGDDAPEVSVVVVTHGTREMTARCLERVRDVLRERSGEIWVVDNASGDGTVERIRRDFPSVHLIENDENVGFGTANNQAMRRARGEAFLLLNSDAELTEEALDRLREELDADPRLAMVGAHLVRPDGWTLPSARRFPGIVREALVRFRLFRLLPRSLRSRLLLGEHALPRHARRPDWVTGACVLVRPRAFEETGGFDEAIFLYGEELDWCARLRNAGWEIGFAPEARVRHEKGATAGPLLGLERVGLALEGDVRYMARHRGRGSLALFAAVRLLGFVLDLSLAPFTGGRERVTVVRYQIRSHLGLTLRYLGTGAS